MKKIYSLAILLLCVCVQNVFAQQIPNTFWGINHWLPEKYLGPPVINLGGAVDYPNVQQLVKDDGCLVYRIGGNGYDTYGTAIGTDTTNNDYIRAIQKVINVNPNAKFLIQVPFKSGTMTPLLAKQLVLNIRAKFPPPYKFYYTIGNEWDRYENPKYTSNQIMTIIKNYAVEMKSADTTIRIVSPSLSYFSVQDTLGNPIMDSLIGGGNDITGIITGSIYPFLNNQYYYIDIVTLHTYGGSYGNLKGLNSANYDTIRNGLINYPVGSFANDLSGLQTLIQNATSRPSSPLTFAITEMNVVYKNPIVPIVQGNKTTNSTEGIGARSFFCGQAWADIMSSVLSSGTTSGNAKIEFVMPWSIHESSGDGDSLDLGMTKGTASSTQDPIPVSSYYHYQLMSQHFLGKYYSGISSIQPIVKTFASLENAGFYIMILNRDTVDYDFNIGFLNANSTYPASLQLQFDFTGQPATTPLDSASQYPNSPINDTIKRESTILLQFSCHGTMLMKMVYSVEDAKIDTTPHLKKIGNIDVDPQFFACNQLQTIGGTITQNTTFINDTVFVGSNILLAGNTKLTFNNSVVIVAQGVQIKATPMASIEIINNSVMFGCDGKQWEGIEMIGNYNNGERLRIENSYLFNAKHPVKTEKIPDLKIIGSVFANGETAIELNRSEAFTISGNLIGGYKTGIKTSNTKPNYVSRISENRFIEIVTDVEFKDDTHNMLDIVCNEFRYKDRAVKSRTTDLKMQGDTTLSAGNKFIYESTGQPINYIDHTGTATKYFFGPAEANEFNYPNVMNIPKIQAVSDKVCLIAFASDCGSWLSVEENGKPTPQLLIYPNPSNGQFTVSLTDLKGETTISVQDILGRTITSQKLKSGAQTASFTLTVQGIYLVTIDNNGQRVTGKVIVH